MNVTETDVLKKLDKKDENARTLDIINDSNEITEKTDIGRGCTKPYIYSDDINMDNIDKYIDILENDEIKDMISDIESMKDKLEIKEDILKYKYEDVEGMSEQLVDALIGAKTLNEMKKFDKLDLDLKKDFLRYIINELKLEFDTAKFQSEMKQMTDEFNKTAKQFIENLDNVSILSDLEEKINNAKDEAEKKRYQEMYYSIHNSLNLNILITRVNNKGPKQIIKECKKNYKQVKSKAIRIMKQDPKTYMNPLNIEYGLNMIVKDEDKKYVEVLAYMIFREITREKKVSVQTNMFINYFIMNIHKFLSLQEGQNDESIDIFTNKINEFIELFK